MRSDDTLRETATQAIQTSHHLLSTESDLSPNNGKITEALTHLVRTLTCCQCSAMTECLLAEKRLAREKDQLPDLCGKAECEMEKYWARKLLSAEKLCLRDFWYIAEYEALCKAEAELIGSRQYDRITFLGSGALPLTAIMLAEMFPQAHVTCVDMDTEACRLSCQLIQKAGLCARVTVLQQDATTYMPAQNELVICAALLQGAEAVYEHILLQPDCDLIVRDSEGVYRFLYREARLPDIRFVEVGKTTLDTRRINTSRYYRQRSNTAAMSEGQHAVA